MKAKYKSPEISIITAPCSMLVSSAHPCNNNCRLWHTCRDRERGKICGDFKYKEL